MPDPFGTFRSLIPNHSPLLSTDTHVLIHTDHCVHMVKHIP